MKTLQLYILTFSVRLFSIMRHQGYLPFDKTGDWFYHMVKGSHSPLTKIERSVTVTLCLLSIIILD